jgi:hypothetical protein
MSVPSVAMLVNIQQEREADAQGAKDDPEP